MIDTAQLSSIAKRYSREELLAAIGRAAERKAATDPAMIDEAISILTRVKANHAAKKSGKKVVKWKDKK